MAGLDMTPTMVCRPQGSLWHRANRVLGQGRRLARRKPLRPNPAPRGHRDLRRDHL